MTTRRENRGRQPAQRHLLSSRAQSLGPAGNPLQGLEKVDNKTQDIKPKNRGGGAPLFHIPAATPYSQNRNRWGVLSWREDGKKWRQQWRRPTNCRQPARQEPPHRAAADSGYLESCQEEREDFRGGRRSRLPPAVCII